MVGWVGLYKLARLAILAGTLLAIALWLYSASRKERLEAPARRMLEDDDLPRDARR
jgi:cbb3-type cytochrome oxidase subunit 3